MARKKNAAVSVVMPVYNVERYLAGAVRSVQEQTHPDWELILVDDGSTDSSGQLCETLAQQDERIRVIHKENGGLASARNAGLDVAAGEWVIFPDSDDFWEPQMLETMLSHSGGADVVCCGLYFFPAMKAGAWVDQERYFASVADMAAEAAALFSLDGVYSACTKLYRRSSIRCRFDDTLRHAEDLIFNLEYLATAQGIRLIPEALYAYRWVNEPTLGKRFWLDQFAISKRALQRSRALFAFSPEACAFFSRWYAGEICWQLSRLSRLESLPEMQRLLLLQVHLEDEIFRDDGITAAVAGSQRGRLWRLLQGGDVQQAWNALQEDGGK